VGRYDVLAEAGRPVGTEEIRCAAGPAGWRWFSEIETVVPEPHRETVDLTVDGAWRPVRLRIRTGAHEAVLAVDGDRLVGRRDGEPVDLPFGPASELDYLTPACNAVTATRLGRSAEIEVVYLDPYTLAPSLVRQRYELEGPDEVATPVGRFEATRWTYTSLDSGWTARFWLAADLVVAYEGLFELKELEPGPGGPFPR
jgi:hypothetical protein